MRNRRKGRRQEPAPIHTTARAAVPDPILIALLSAIGAHVAIGCSSPDEAGIGTTPRGTPDGSVAGGGTGGGTSTGGRGATLADAGNTGSIGGASAGSSGGGAGGIPLGLAGCRSPRPHISEATGWIACDGGFFHRTHAGTCVDHPEAAIEAGASEDAGLPPYYGDCTDDAHCRHLPRGRCWDPGLFCGEIGSLAYCVTDCVTDADCPADHVCFCDDQTNRCVPSDCASDATCGDGLLCTTFENEGGGTPPVEGASCQTPNDACVTEVLGCRSCIPDESGVRICDEGFGGCGRPFLVDGAARVAALASEPAWSDPASIGTPSRAGLSADVRKQLADQFTRLGLMEHASVAAFARFALELVGVGAPPELLAEAARAMDDERRHAVICFTLASHYAGGPVGPGPIRLEGCAASGDLAALVDTTFLEGCIGETVAALEARALAEQAVDPVLRGAFGRIAEDETGHAALAWRLVAWAATQDRPRVIAVLARHRARLVEELSRRASGAPHHDDAAPRHDDARFGLLTPARSQAVRSRGLRAIVIPCLDALLEGSEPSRSTTHTGDEATASVA